MNNMDNQKGTTVSHNIAEVNSLSIVCTCGRRFASASEMLRHQESEAK
jgi:hypothetical protein